MQSRFKSENSDPFDLLHLKDVSLNHLNACNMYEIAMDSLLVHYPSGHKAQ